MKRSLIALMLVCFVSSAHAQPVEPTDDDADPKDVLDEDSVFTQTARRRPLDVLLEYGPLKRLEEAWLDVNDRLEDSRGLRFGIAYTTLAQFAPDTGAGPGPAQPASAKTIES